MSQKGQYEIRKRLARLLGAGEEKTWEGLLGDASGTIKVEGHSDLRYVRPVGCNLPVVVHKGSAPDLKGTHVKIGRSYKGDRQRIMGVAEGGGSAIGVEHHAPTHRWPGGDPVLIETLQILDALVWASGGMVVTINEGWVVVDGQPVHLDEQTLDVTLNIPAGAAYSLIRVDADGAIDVQDGTPVDSYADLTWEDVPAVATGFSLLAILRLYDGQTELSRNYDWPDVIDCRYVTAARMSGGVSDLDLGWLNVEDYGAVHDGVTDDTEAIQDAIDAAEAAGGGVIYFPVGIYIVNGALQDVDGANAQIVLPSIDPTTDEMIPIAFMGEREAGGLFAISGVDTEPRIHGTIIEGTLNSGVGGSMIGCAGIEGLWGFSEITAIFRNMTLRMPDNPVLTALNAIKVSCLKIDDLVIDVGFTAVDDITEPTTSTSYGLKTPGNANGAHTYINGLFVLGFYTGASLAEHTNADELAFFGCKYAVEFPASSHPLQIGRINITDCEYGLTWSGFNRVKIEELMIERYDGSPSKWFDPVYDIYDPNNYGRGYIVYNVFISGGTPDVITYSSGYKLNICHMLSGFREDSWVYEWETCTYASASTFTIAGNRTDRYTKGMKLKIQQPTGAVKYFYVISSNYGAPNTTVTINGGSDYALANEAISFLHYSRGATPNGFPQWFHVAAPTIACIDDGAGGQPTISEAKFSMNGRIVVAHLRGSGVKDTVTAHFNFPDTAFVTPARTEYSGRSVVGSCHIFTTSNLIGAVLHYTDNEFYGVFDAAIADNTVIDDFSVTMTYEI